MTALFVAAGALIAASGALVLFRLLAGPTLHDRLVALDTMVVLLVCGIAVRSAHLGELDNLVLLVLIVLVGLLSSLAVVRLLPTEDQ